MKFIHHRLGHVAGGSVVEVTLKGGASNVRLMDQSNFNNYKAGRRHQYHGGLARKSPVRLRVPRSGTWHVTVDMQGLRGTARSGIRVIPAEALKPLPAINEGSLRDLPSLVRNVTQEQVPGVEAPDERVFDVFISHTSEDKDEVVRPLATALRDAGLKVWYDEFELRIGDSLRRKIDKGLASSRFGVVVLSQDFFGRGYGRGVLLHHLGQGLDPGQETEPIHAETDCVHRVCQRRHRKRGGKGFRATGTTDILSHGVVLPLGFAAPGA